MSKMTTQEFLDHLGIEVGKPFMCEGEKLTVEMKTYIDGTISGFVCDGDGIFAELHWLLDKEIAQLPKYTLTEDDGKLVSVLPKNYHWLVRQESGNLWLFMDKPKKYVEIWLGDVDWSLTIFNELLPFIKWEDEEPVSLDELRKCL